MKYSFSIPRAQEVNDDKISLSEALLGVTVPAKCKSGKDIFFHVPFPSGEKINKGDTLVEIIFYRTDDSYKGHYFDDELDRYIIKCEHSGYIVHDFSYSNYSIDELLTPITIYSTIEELIDELYSISYQIKRDDFTAEKSIEWILEELNSDDFSDSDDNDSVGPSYLSKYLLEPSIFIDLTVEKNLPTLVFGFSRRRFNVYKRDTLSFKFEDGRILHFPVLASPTNGGLLKYQNTVSVALSASDIEQFENVSWEKLRIEHFNGDAPVTLDNVCRQCQAEGFAQAFFKKYVHVYKHALNELGIALNAVPKRPAYESVKLAQDEDACYVYLMIDSSNGYHKIGISNHPDYREKTLQSEKPAIEKICAKRFPSRIIAQAIESALHTAFASKRIRGEWFNLSDKDVAQIIETLR